MKEDLGGWISMNTPAYNMSYAVAANNQFKFVYDDLWALRNDPDKVDVIGTHLSKSIDLPIYQFELFDKVITMRNDFYVWMISIKSPTDVHGLDMLRLFDPKNEVNPTHCEGMEDLVYGSYESDKREFTLRLENNNEVYCFLRLLFACSTNSRMD